MRLSSTKSAVLALLALFAGSIVSSPSHAIDVNLCGTIAPNGLSTYCVASQPQDWIYNAGGGSFSTQGAAHANLTPGSTQCGEDELSPGGWTNQQYHDTGQTLLRSAELEYTITQKVGPDCVDSTHTAILMNRTRSVTCPEGYDFATKNGARTLLLCAKYAGSIDYGENLGKPCKKKGQCTAGNPINLSNGNKYQSETDYVGFGSFPLAFERRYNSLAQLDDSNNGVYAFSPSGGYGGSGATLSAVDTLNDPDRRALAIGAIGANWRHTYHRAIQVTQRHALLLAAIYREDGAVYQFVMENESSGSPATINAQYTGPDFQIVSETDPQSGELLWVIRTPENTVETYSEAGRLLSIDDNNGNTVSLTYDVAGRLDLVTDQFGRTLDFDYAVDPVPGETYTDTEGLLNQITRMYDPSGDLYEYHYDNINGGQLIRVDYPDATSRTYHYDDPNHPFALTGISIHSTSLAPTPQDRYATWAYDSVGRAILSYHGTGSDITDRVDIDYYIDNKGTSFTGRWQSKYATVTESAGTPEQWVKQYRSKIKQNVGRISKITEGPSTSLNGAPDSSLTQTRVIQYTSHVDIKSVTDERGSVKRYEYTQDSRRLVSAIIEAYQTPEERRTEIEWHSEFELPRTVRRPSVNGTGSWHVTQFNYELDPVTGADSRRVSSIVENGFDVSGNPISRTTSFTYDTNGRIASVDGPLPGSGDTTTYSYHLCASGGPCGELSSITDALGHVTGFDNYDGDGRVGRVTEPNGMLRDLSYDGVGRLNQVSVTPVPGSGLMPRVSTITYSDMGLPESVTDESGMTLSYAYDSAMNLVSSTAPNGDEVSLEHDPRGNVSKQSRKFANATVAFWTEYLFDADGRLIADKRPKPSGVGTDDWVAAFDLAGQMTSSTDPAGYVTTYSGYDALGRVSTITANATDLSSFDYDVKDNVTDVVSPNGSTTTMSYDDFGRLTSESSADRGLLTMTYDLADNVLTRTDGEGRVTTYSYDSVYRLLQITKTVEQFDGTAVQQSTESVSLSYDLDPLDASNQAYGLPLPVSASFD
ncbi:MAG: DUF6531 domain-containing protein, partial [Pseudomonadota bacterium]